MNVNLPPQNPGVTSPGSQGTNVSQGTSSSQSTSQILESSQAQLEQQIAAAAAQLGDYQYQWGLNQYASTSAMTNASIENYLAASQQDMNLANQSMQQYETTTVPEINQQANMAAQYTSPSRVGINMGAAESQSEQGSNAALAAAKQNLQSYGINPNSGEYQELTMANKTAGGAAAAGAGQQAQLATEATGRQLLASSIATGQQLPGQAINASNAAYTGIAGGENAALANANTGVALTTSANPYLSTAMSLKYPSVGTTSTSSSQNTAAGQNTNIPLSTTQSGTMGSGYDPNATANNIAGFGYSQGGEIGNQRNAGDFSFASGGDATQGGYVPQHASPSGGVNVDDVPANLNAEEFVIPRDVARWKGEEFWHKEIAKSRAARAKAAATVGPTAGPPQAPGQQPTFTSQSFRGGSQQRFAAGGTTATDTMGSWGGANLAGGYGTNTAGVPKISDYSSPTTSPSMISSLQPSSTPTTSPAPYTSPGMNNWQGEGQSPILAASTPSTTTPSTSSGYMAPATNGPAYGSPAFQQTSINSALPQYKQEAKNYWNKYNSGMTPQQLAQTGNYGKYSIGSTNNIQSGMMARGGSVPRRRYSGGGI